MRKLGLTILGVGALLLCVAPILAHAPGRWTGGGSIFTNDGVRVTHGFELYCNPDGTSIGAPVRSPNNLEINWNGNNFHLEGPLMASCYDDTPRDPGPQPPPNTSGVANLYNGCGYGRYNGVSGALACWIFTDHGEPGVNDTAEYTIIDKDGNLVLGPTGRKNLTFGNHQVHQVQPNLQ
jgi:hypothetical protein